MVDINNMDELCKGCVLYEQYHNESGNHLKCVGYLIKDVECPCINCLLKMMCDKVCEELSNTSWWYDYVGNRKDYSGGVNGNS